MLPHVKLMIQKQGLDSGAEQPGGLKQHQNQQKMSGQDLINLNHDSIE